MAALGRSSCMRWCSGLVRDLTLLNVSGGFTLQPLTTCALAGLKSLTIREAPEGVPSWPDSEDSEYWSDPEEDWEREDWVMPELGSVAATLEVIDVSHCAGLVSIDAVRSCVKLRCLQMPGVGVFDLSPLAACSQTLEELWMAAMYVVPTARPRLDVVMCELRRRSLLAQGDRSPLKAKMAINFETCTLRCMPGDEEVPLRAASEVPGRGASSDQGAKMSPGHLTSCIKGCTSSDELLSLVEQHGQVFNQIHCATILSHAAQLVARHRCVIPRSGIERMVQLAQERLPAMGAQALANSAHALAKLGHKDDVFMAALLKAADPQLRDFIPQHLANTAWALATLGHADGDLMAALMKAAKPQLRDFTPQELANTVWALGTLGHADADFMAALLEAAKPQLRDFTPQNLANMAWALATLGHADNDLMAALLKAAKPQLRDFTPHNLANMAWALATLGHTDRAFMAALLAAAKLQLREFNPQALANTAWALASLGHADAAFMAALLKAAKPQLRNFNPQNLANTAWALAVLDHADNAFMESVLQKAAGMVFSFESQHLIQLFMCMLWLEDQHSDVVVHEQLAAACKMAWMEERGDALPSRVQLEVLAAVRQLPGCSGATSEQTTDDGLFSIDIAVQLLDGSRLAVEVDGPTHFLSNAPTAPNGATCLRNRLLEERSWRVVSVPARTGWDPHAQRGQQAAREYLLSLGVGPV
ncbi:hypothetical protein FOA52_013090 [Chlamydomonas sp. UWO 241]|nr:hypothetical protein FOA52_013090 [Chlamydomonas sp. UWO 241]